MKSWAFFRSPRVGSADLVSKGEGLLEVEVENLPQYLKDFLPHLG
jgi:hypothetical protein